MRESLLGKTPDELREVAIKVGLPAFAGKQLAGWLYGRRVRSFDEMTNISKAGRERLKEEYDLGVTMPSTCQVSKDGTKKYLFPMNEGDAVEAVMIPDDDRKTLCVSSQAGCRMGCKFCASGLNGLTRNLLASEILAQIIMAGKDNGIRVSNVVMMGMGEPLDNFENSAKFLRLVSDEIGLNIGLRHISLSTCGVVKGIDKLATLNMPITLSVSLHAPFDDIRNNIMPINRKWNIQSLISACKRYQAVTTRRISFEYALISGVNDTDACAKELARITKGILCHINLIPANPVNENSFSKPQRGKINSFRNLLRSYGLTATVRRTLGSDIDASCGQLRRRLREEKKSADIQ